MKTQQSSLSGLQQDPETGDIEQTVTEPEQQSEELSEILRDAGIGKRASESIEEHCSSVDELLDYSDINIQDWKWVGPKTVETIRRELDDSYGEDYTITDSGDGFNVSQWTEKADERTDILTGESLLRILGNKLGHQSKVIDAITEWAGNQPTGRNGRVADELIHAAFSLTPSEVNFATLFDEDEDYNSDEKKAEAQQEALLKARAVMAFADLTDRRSLYGRAEDEAIATIEAEKQGADERKKREIKAERQLKFPPSEIAGWKQIKYGLANLDNRVVAYRGRYNNAPSVVALYDTGEFVKVHGFRIMEWIEADQNPIEASVSFSTASTPETMVEGMADLVDWLSENPCRDQELTDVNELQCNGWYLVKDIEGEVIVYEDPDRNVKYLVEGENFVMKAHGKTQTVEMESHREAIRALYNQLRTVDTLSNGGVEMEVPYPDRNTA